MVPIGLVVFGWISFCGLVFIAFWIVTVIRLNKLNRYLKNNNYKKWCEITSIDNFGPGLSNPFRAWHYIFKDINDIDEETLRLKYSARSSMRTCSPMFSTKTSPPWPMADACRTRWTASGMVIK